MVNDKIKLNTIIEILDDDKKYLCRVLDETEKTISVDIPIYGSEYLFLNADDEVEVTYLVESECYYRGTCTVIKRYRNNIYLYMLTRPKDLRKIQRRNFVRARTLDNIKYTFEESDTWKDGIMLDLSGGGMRVCLNDKFSIGDEIEINIDDENGEIELSGEIVRVEETDNVYGVEFKDLDERKRDRLVKKVFTIMLRERKRV